MSADISDTIRENIAASLDGYAVGFADGSIQCATCGQQVPVTDSTGSRQFFARVENTPSSGRTNIGAIYCSECEATEITTPTKGIHEARVTVEVAPRSTKTPIVTDLVTVHDYSSASQGAL